MQQLQQQKVVAVTSPGAIVNNAAFTTATVDTAGWDEVQWVVILGALDIAIAAMKLQESDDSGMSGAVDIAGGDFSVSPATLPSATDDNHIFGLNVKCGGPRKRYQDLSLTGGNGSTGTYATVIAILSKGETTPSTTAGRGYTQNLTV
jgi:hypothetical protein